MSVSINKLRPGALSNLSVVSLHKVVQLAGLVVTVAVVPRLFGAQDYGRFAFVLSLSYLGQVLGDFGTLDVMGRFVPTMTPAESGQLYMRTLVFKVVVGILCGTLTGVAALALGQWMRPEWALLTGLSVTLHIVAWVPFQFSLGLNRVGRWMAEQAWRQWVLLFLLLALLPLFGFGGVLLAVMLMEVLFCGLGLWWTRDFWQRRELTCNWSYLRPYIWFGSGFFLANMTTVALYRSGPVLVETLTAGSAQTGYLNLALGLFLMAYVTLGQFAQSLIPTLSGFRATGQTRQMQQWLHNFVRFSWLVGWVGTISVWLVADWLVPLVFGVDFTPAAAAMKWLSLGVPMAALLWAGNTIATVTGRGRVKFAASLSALLIFAVLAVWLTPGYGAAGAALALTLSVTVNVAVLSLLLRADFLLDWSMLILSTVMGAVCLGALAWLSWWL